MQDHFGTLLLQGVKARHLAHDPEQLNLWVALAGMSAIGTKQTFRGQPSMSTFGGKTGIAWRIVTGRSVFLSTSSMEATMTRLILATIAALAIGLAGLQPAKAQAPWCAVITIGEDSVYWDCRYSSIEQCRPNVLAGNRGFCNPNPYYAANAAEPRRSAKRRARPQ